MLSSTSCDLELAMLIQAAGGAYHKEIEQISGGYVLADFKDDFKSGFKYAVYKNGNNIILSFAGTDANGLHINSKDLIADVNMGIGVLPKQAKEAMEVYAELKKNNPNANITITGHSLGGSLAQMVGAVSGVKTVTFNPYGTKHLFGHLKSFGINPSDAFENITNYKTSNDLLYSVFEKGKSKNNPGLTYIIPDTFAPMDSHNNLMEIPCGDKIPSNLWEDMQDLKNITIEEWRQMFSTAESTYASTYIDPILIDLNQDGIISTTSTNDGTYFDHQGDGFAETSAWVSSEDGILAIDKNNNGYIDNGSEIFGDNYIKSNNQKATNGFDALKDLDSNNDNIINSQDEAFSQIKILKGDGTILTLNEAGIESINLNTTTKNTTDENGNTLINQSTFIKTDGTEGILGDFNLNVDKMNSFATQWLDETQDVSELPEILGSGTVYSLHQTIMRDETNTLKQLVQNFITAQDAASKKNIANQIIFKWTDADSIWSGSRGDNIISIDFVDDRYNVEYNNNLDNNLNLNVV